MDTLPIIVAQRLIAGEVARSQFPDVVPNICDEYTPIARLVPIRQRWIYSQPVKCSSSLPFCGKSNDLVCFAVSHFTGNSRCFLAPHNQILEMPSRFAQDSQHILGVLFTLHEIHRRAFRRVLKRQFAHFSHPIPILPIVQSIIMFSIFLALIERRIEECEIEQRHFFNRLFKEVFATAMKYEGFQLNYLSSGLVLEGLSSNQGGWYRTFVFKSRII